MSPEKCLDALSVNPGAKTELAFGDFDLLVFAFFVLTAGSAGGGLLCFRVRILLYVWN